MQLGPGRFQMMQQQVCDDCPNVKYGITIHLLIYVLYLQIRWNQAVVTCKTKMLDESIFQGVRLK